MISEKQLSGDILKKEPLEKPLILQKQALSDP